MFLGQIKLDSEYDIFDGEAVCSNTLTLDKNILLENLQNIQKLNEVEKSEDLETLDFSIEMETGTGKTYVYIKKALDIFDDAKHKILLESDGIVYKECNEYYEFKNIFPDEQSGYDLEKCQKGLYTHEQYDSDVEKDFINCADKFKFFTKLPTRFKIKTPLGNYSPDFAIIKYDESEGSFIVETKGSERQRDLRGCEAWKIEYAKNILNCWIFNIKIKLLIATRCNYIPIKSEVGSPKKNP